MSLILDALRKADAQRERDPARGIHAQPVQVSSQLKRPESQQRRLWLWGLGVMAAALLAVLAWQFARPAASPVAIPIALAPAAEGGTSAAAALTPSLPTPITTPAAPATEVIPAAAPAPAPPPTRAVQPAAPVAATVAPVRQAQKPASAPLASAPVLGDRVLSVNELPADVQRDLPKLVISAGVYSDNPAQRLLIVNGQAVAEGAEPAPGVLLEQIRARTAVLKYRGYRYSLTY